MNPLRFGFITSLEQEQVTVLQNKLKKAQDNLILIQNKDNALDVD